jgi:hypothetical protein
MFRFQFQLLEFLILRKGQVTWEFTNVLRLRSLNLESVTSSRGYFVVLECLGCQIVHTQLGISI